MKDENKHNGTVMVAFQRGATIDEDSNNYSNTTDDIRYPLSLIPTRILRWLTWLKLFITFIKHRLNLPVATFSPKYLQRLIVCKYNGNVDFPDKESNQFANGDTTEQRVCV